MIREESRSSKKKIALAAVLIGAVLMLLTFSFIQYVKKQLWEQSVSAIVESTSQGCNALQMQLQHDFASMKAAAEKISEFSGEQMEQAAGLMEQYSRMESNISLYLRDGSCYPEGLQKDSRAEADLWEGESQEGILNPHISSATGMNVFDLYVKVTMTDGTEGCLVKEYEVVSIAESFSLSFYKDSGFSYIINTQGDVLIRSPHPNSNKTVKNLFDMLPESQNQPESLEAFANSLQEFHTGWAVFRYQGEDTVFCYTPLKLESDWYLISIIPEKVVSEQSRDILTRSMVLIASIILGIIFLVLFYIRSAAKTKRKLDHQAEYIVHLYNVIPEGIALITTDPPHRFLQINEEGLRLLQYQEGSQDDVPEDVSLRDMIHPEDYGEAAQLFRETSEASGKHVFTARLKRAEGSYFWAGGIVEKTQDENGEPVLIAAFHDITDEKTAEEAKEKEQLQERITLVGALANAYPVIIQVNLTNEKLGFIYVQPGLMLDLGRQKSYSELYEDMAATIHPDHVSKFRLHFAPENLYGTLGHTKNEVFIEAKQMLADGRYHWIATQIIYVDNPYSGDELAILISRRSDEQRYEEEQRRQALQSALDNANAANRGKSQFLSNMSHDIRTPINAIVGMTSIAAAHLDDTRRVDECLKKIALSSRHLLGLINDVLDMSKIESGKLTLREEPFNFAELITETVELIRTQAYGKQLQTDVCLAALKNENVTGDPLRLQQVCLNILSNAVKYTPSGGRIRIEVSQEDSTGFGYQCYVFRCADTGIGMKEEFLKMIFQPFERAQDSTSSKIAGTGLGMAITKNLVDLMNGEIQVESKTGIGSVFTVRIPLKVQDAPEEKVPDHWRGVRTLIVDGNVQSRENTVRLLADMGLPAEAVGSGEEAVSYIMEARDSGNPCGLVFINCSPGEGGGAEAVRLIREHCGAKSPALVLTAGEWAEIEYEGKETDAAAFLSLPFYRSKVYHLLKELDSGSRLPQQSEETAPDYSRKRLLLVEDNELNREIAVELIGSTGVQIEEACDGEEAVKKVEVSEEGYYDMIIMDIKMPIMDGYEATRVIRSMNRRDVKTIPIVAMTANAFEEDVRTALRMGMNAHVSKPIDTGMLNQLLAQYLSDSGA